MANHTCIQQRRNILDNNNQTKLITDIIDTGYTGFLNLGDCGLTSPDSVPVTY
jgi:hypothetical protein